MMRHSITIDGLSGVGKTAVAAMLAQELGYSFLSVGLIFRCLSWLSLRNVDLNQLDWNDITTQRNADGYTDLFFRNENITSQLYEDVQIEKKVNDLQTETLQFQVRDFIRKRFLHERVVLEGRNASLILPDAVMKVYLYANEGERKKRIIEEINRRGNAAQSDQFLEAAMERDYQDLTRLKAPLRYEPDMLLWDSSHLTLEQTVNGLKRYYLHHAGISPLRSSIIIPVRNNEYYLDLCLSHLQNQDIARSEYEIIVVDDHSTDQSLSVAKSHGVKAVRADGRGPSSARNTGIMEAQGNILIFLDSDMLVPPDFVRNHIQFHAFSNRLLLLGARRHLPEGTVQITPQYRKDSREALLERYALNINSIRYPWSIAYTCNVSAPADLVKTTLFDEEFNGWGLEDVEWAYRMGSQGVNWAFSKRISGYHLYHDRTMNREKYESWLRNLARFLMKHDGHEVQRFEVFKNVFDPQIQADYMNIYDAFNGTRRPLSCNYRICDLTTVEPGARLHKLQELLYKEPDAGHLIVIDDEHSAASYRFESTIPILDVHNKVRFYTSGEWSKLEPTIINQYGNGLS